MMAKKVARRPVVTALNYEGRIGDFLSRFTVYPALTKKLDTFRSPFNQSIANEMILWKVARYAEIPNEVLSGLTSTRNLDPGAESDARQVFSQLLAINGVRLPMASTFLRFANPRVFQIFDRHIYRAVYGGLPGNISKDPILCWKIYSKFLCDLRSQCMKLKIRFEDSDRILFEFDKAINPPLTSQP